MRTISKRLCLTCPPVGTNVPRMAAKKRPELKIRFETFSALDRIRKAAKLDKRTVNQFVRLAAEEAAEKLVTTSKMKAGQLTDSGDPLSLNQ